VGYPIGVPASPLTASPKWIQMLAEQGFNVLTFKTNRGRERASLPAPNWVFLDQLEKPLPLGTDMARFQAVASPRKEPADPQAFSMANSFGIPSLPVDQWASAVADAIAVLQSDQLLIVSVVGEYETLSGDALVADFVNVALHAEDAIAAHPTIGCGRAIEVNLSCPNTIPDGDDAAAKPLCEDAAAAQRIVRAVRAALKPDTKLVIKLGYLAKDELTDLISDIAHEVDAVAGINTLQIRVAGDDGRPAFLGTLDDADAPREHGGLSGVAIRSYAIDFVRSLALLRRSNDWRFDIIGMGGVMDSHDVRTLLAIGANAVQTATAAANHPRFPSELLGGGRPEPSEEEELAQLLAAALADQTWEFRTREGLANELRLSPEEVGVLIQRHPDIARTSVMKSPEGHELFTHRDRPVTARERIEQLRSLVARDR